MRYVKAQNVLPEEVIKIIQKYIDGEFIYIPRKDGGQKAWGEKSGARDSLRERNSRIYGKYIAGAAVEELCSEYYLSEQSIRRIISQVRKYRKIEDNVQVKDNSRKKGERPDKERPDKERMVKEQQAEKYSRSRSLHNCL